MAISNHALRLTLALMPAAVLLTANLSADAAIYTYKDANGNTVYSDQPPPGTNTTTLNTSTATSTTSTPSACPNIVQKGLMPAVDTCKNIKPVLGATDLRVASTTEVPTAASSGAFRIECFVSHMSNDDPLVYPNQPGASPHKTFFGNTSVNAKSNLSNLATIGNGTCKGGIMNRSSYAVPSMIDTSTHTPIAPEKAVFYYKTAGLSPRIVTAPPKGLRMITGNANANSEETSQAMFTCVRPSGQPFYGWKKSIPACVVGETMQMLIRFPQCWDGKNLDSADHKSHMAHTNKATKSCPASHPIGMPEIALGLNFKITSENRTQFWRLSTDNYDPSKPPGYSANADWINGWDETVLKSFVKNCLNASKDCHAHLIGDGRKFYRGIL